MKAAQKLFVSALSARRASTLAFEHAELPAAVAETKKSFFLAALPWRATANETSAHLQSKLASTSKATLEDGDSVIASFFSTSKLRKPPMLSSILSQLPASTSSTSAKGGAWLLMRASSVEDAIDVLRKRIVASDAADSTIDVDKAVVTRVEVAEEATTSGPLFNKPDFRAEHEVQNNGPLYWQA